jgi:rubrerythrin
MTTNRTLIALGLLIIACQVLCFRAWDLASVTSPEAKGKNGEALAYAKYLLYAEHARKHGHPELARLFEETAKVERLQHFAEEAALAGFVGSDADNLRDAIKGESYEVDTMYREFAEQAKTGSDPAAADRFEEVRTDEMGHRDAFKTALAKLEKELAAEKQDVR